MPPIAAVTLFVVVAELVVLAVVADLKLGRAGDAGRARGRGGDSVPALARRVAVDLVVAEFVVVVVALVVAVAAHRCPQLVRGDAVPALADLVVAELVVLAVVADLKLGDSWSRAVVAPIEEREHDPDERTTGPQPMPALTSAPLDE